MAITVRDIVELAQKKGCVLATGESKLSKEVYYVDTMEIPDMEAWMKPNVLLVLCQDLVQVKMRFSSS